MRKLLRLSKTLLVAAGLLVGVNSAWADETANLTPTADTYFDWGNKATSYGSAETLPCGIWQEMWTNGTPGLKANGSEKIAVFKFDVSEYKGKITSATFKVTASNPSTNSNTRSIYLGYFTSTSWDESTTAENSSMVTRHASNLNIQPFNISQSIAKGETKEVSFSSDAFLSYLNNDEDGIVSLIVYGVGQQCTVNSKEAATGKPQLVIEYANETLYTASFTEGNSLIPTVTIYSDSEKTATVSNGTLTDKTTYYFTASLAGYENYEGSFTVNGANPTVNFTMTAKVRYTFTVNAVDGGGAIIKALYTDEDSYDGKAINVAFAKYLTGEGNIVTYSKADNTYFTNYVSSSGDATKSVTYTAYNGIAYFFEGESFSSKLGTTTNNANYSSNTAARGLNNTTLDVITIPTSGIYSLSYAACSNNVNSARTYAFYKNNSENVIETQSCNWSVNKVLTDGTKTINNISLSAGDILQFYAGDTNIILDYVLLELTGVSATISAAGWSTLYTDYALNFSGTGLTAYTATCDGSKVTLTEVENVPAGTGVVLKGTAKDYDIPVAASSSTAKGDLKGSTTDAKAYETDYNYYYLALNGESKAQFKKLTSGSIAAGKAYLQLDKGITAPSFDIDFGGTTGINMVKGEESKVNGEYYNLAGQRVAQPTKGLYIVNGKKIVIK